MPAMVVRELAVWLGERGGSLVAGDVPPALDRSVEGVTRPRRFIPRELDALDAHDVVFAAADTFTTGTGMTLTALVTALAESQAALVVSGLPPRAAAPDPAPYATADALAFPLFAVPALAEGGDMLRALAEEIAVRQGAMERETRAAQAALARARREADALPHLALALARHSHLACVVEDARRVTLTCALPDAGWDVATVEAALTSYAARRAVRPATPGGLGEDIPVQRHLPGEFARAIIPIHAGEVLLGYLSLVGPEGTVTPRTVEILWRVVPSFIPALRAERAPPSPPRPALPDPLAALLAGTLAEGDRARLAADWHIDLAAPHAVLLARVAPDDSEAGRVWARAQMERLALTPQPRLATVRGPHLALLLSAAEAEGDLAALVATLGWDDAVAVGVGRAAGGSAGWQQSLAEAEQALHAALRMPTRHLRHDDLGVLTLFVPPAESARAFAEAQLDPLLAGDPHGTLLATLETFFATNGNTFGAAQRLGLHRNTLTYRLNRIQELLGISLDDPDVRLALHLALKIRRMMQPPL